nr:MAG TPA: hypothetical protein [Caudoviricetes sp.]
MFFILISFCLVDKLILNRGRELIPSSFHFSNIYL